MHWFFFQTRCIFSVSSLPLLSFLHSLISVSWRCLCTLSRLISYKFDSLWHLIFSFLLVFSTWFFIFNCLCPIFFHIRGWIFLSWNRKLFKSCIKWNHQPNPPNWNWDKKEQVQSKLKKLKFNTSSISCFWREKGHWIKQFTLWLSHSYADLYLQKVLHRR